MGGYQRARDIGITHISMKEGIMRGFAVIGLHAAKNPHNVGHVLRAADCFGASSVIISGGRYRRTAPDTTAAYRHMPLIQVADLHDAIPFDCVPVAVDILPGAIPLDKYHHPERAFYVFGPEDGTLGEKVTGWCRDVIYMPTKFCLNLAAAVNCVLYDRASKRGEWFHSA